MKIGILITISLLLVSCLQVSERHIDTKEFNLISNETYATFVNCSIYPHRKDNIFIYDKFNNESVIERYLVKFERGVIYIKPILPKMSKIFTPVEQYKSTDGDILKANMALFFRLHLKELIYNKGLRSLVISTEKTTYLHQLSMNSQQHIPESYLKIKTNWYYFNK
jgi:hypothetical protein